MCNEKKGQLNDLFLTCDHKKKREAKSLPKTLSSSI